MRSPKLPAADDSRRVYVPHGIRTGVLLKPSRAGSPLGHHQRCSCCFGLYTILPSPILYGVWRAGACKRARDITRVDATWNAARRGTTQGTHTGNPHRGDPHRGPTQGTRTGDPHRGPTQRGGPHRGPTTGGEGYTGDPHKTHTDKLPMSHSNSVIPFLLYFSCVSFISYNSHHKC